jgi:RND family efflux transporter MFP subunit
LVLTPVLVSGFMAGCSEADGAENAESEEAATPRRVVRVETSVAAPQRFEERISLTGTVEATNDVTISAEAGGRVDFVAELGTRVEKGTLVARFDERLLKSQAAAAEAEYNLARDTYERQKALFADSVISELEFENARTRRDQAKANYDRAQKQFEDTQLKSPVAGRVEVRYVEAGELVNPGTPVVRVVDTRHVKISAGVPERYAADIDEGADVSVRLPALGIDGNAQLSFVGSVVNPQSRTFEVEIDMENRSGLLKPEMVADLTIERRIIENAIVIPQNAMVHDDLGTSVFVVEESNGDRIARRRDVEVGASFRGQTVIRSGVSAGDEVVVVGQANLTEGNLVEVVGS